MQPKTITISGQLNVGKRRASKGVTERYEGLWRSPLKPTTSAMGLGCVKTPVCDPRVEILSRFRQLENQKYLRPLLGEDDRENNSAHSRLVHVFTQPGSKAEVGCCKI